ncbi:hypothetical protein AVDCRST_MAG94-1360 [uncultured Leptolyngbya sp.]|uniref:Uncharacterized protein n=1 Tax=uncultured Leptolyngbya sp. TaxID=332963 RepID=A0A6J4L072_9CYAN|nr:hypothetical protein AVDCRST_MAG94-1360 [uncultured Leptolyngbya sp.]
MIATYCCMAIECSRLSPSPNRVRVENVIGFDGEQPSNARGKVRFESGAVPQL